jgi:hypothetical protein
VEIDYIPRACSGSNDPKPFFENDYEEDDYLVGTINFFNTMPTGSHGGGPCPPFGYHISRLRPYSTVTLFAKFLG